MDTAVNTVCKQGLLKKVKPNMRSKYFVVHKDGAEMSARLEYYDNIKQFDSKKKPKKTVYLRTCFSVNVFTNKNVKCGMVLYTKDDSFPIGFENEEDRDSWLMTIRALINVHRDARPMFEHVWNVTIRERGLGKPYVGDYRLCLKDRNVMFVKKAAVDPEFVFPLEVIRCCGHSDNFFNFEVGRQASTGPGEFWMEVDDGLIAENVHQAIGAVMNKPKEDGDSFRSESSSNSRSNFDTRSGSLSGESSGRNNRTKRSQSSRLKAIQSNHINKRGRSDSLTSRSTTATASTIVGSSTSDITGGMASGGPATSVGDLSISTSGVSGGTADTLITTLPDSRSSTPVRSLTPDSRAAVEPKSDDNYIPMDMSASHYNSAHLRDERSNSRLSSSGMPSRDLTSSALLADPAACQTDYADMTLGNNSLVVRPKSIGVASDDGSYADMRALNVPTVIKPSGFNSIQQSGVNDDSYADMGPLNLQTTKPAQATLSIIADNDSSYAEMEPPNLRSTPAGSSHISISKSALIEPDRSQSYIAKHEEESSPYLAMEPGALLSRTGGGINDAPYLDMAPTGGSGGNAVLGSSVPSNDSAYLDMAPISATSSVKSGDSPYLDMTPVNSNIGGSAGVTRPLSNSQYMDMSPRTGSTDNVVHARANSLQLSIGALDDVKNPYIDMSGRDAHGSSHHKERRRMDSIRSYLSSSENVMEDVPLRHYSVGSRPTALQKPPNPDQYVDMCLSRDFAGKSLSVPHLMPLSLASNPDLTHLQGDCGVTPPSQKQDSFMMLNFDRPRTCSETFKHRPRVSTWSNSIRPRSSSHGQKQHQLGAMSNSSRESLHSATSDYVDMKAGGGASSSGSGGGGDTYVEMVSRDHHSYHNRPNGSGSRNHRKSSHPVSGLLDGGNKLLSKLSSPKASLSSGGVAVAAAKSNSFDTLSDRSSTNMLGEYVGFLPDDVLRNPQLGLIGRRMSQPHQTIEPFPELSASSEEEIAMRSAASSFSSRSSSSSRSSLAPRGDSKSSHYGGGAQLDPESYLECQQVTLRGSNPHAIPSHSSTILKKPTRVASFISEEPPSLSPAATSPIKAEKKDRRSKSRKSEKSAAKNYVEAASGSGSESKQMSKLSRALHSIKLPQPSQAAASKPALPKPPPPAAPPAAPPMVDAVHAVKQQQQLLTNQDVQSTQCKQSVGPELHTQLSSSQLFTTAPQSNWRQSFAAPTPVSAASPPSPPQPSSVSQSPNTSHPPKDRSKRCRPSAPQLTISSSLPNHTPAPVVDAYVEMAPVSKLESAIAPVLVVAPHVPVVTAAHSLTTAADAGSDDYTLMTPLVKDGQLHYGGGLHLFKALPVIDKLEAISNMDARSESCTEATNLTSVGTGSSGDSNQTLQLEDPEAKLNQPVYPQFSITAKRPKQPKSVPCYIRQNSQDFHIYPRPDIPANCYIRSESNLSHSSELGVLSPTRSRAMHDDLLESLVDADQKPFDEAVFYHNNSMAAAFDGLRRGPNDPISPIRLPMMTDSVKSPGYSRSVSEASTAGTTLTDIPGSAAELQWQMKNSKKQLDQVQEEEGNREPQSMSRDGGSSGGSSKEGGANGPSIREVGKEVGKEGGVKPVKSYILDDTKRLSSKPRSKSASAPPPLAVRLVSLEEKSGSGRHSSPAEPSSATSELLNYVDIKHEDKITTVHTSSSGNIGSGSNTNNQSSSPKSAPDGSSALTLQMVGSPACDVNYTTIDHEKTQELSKKSCASVSH